MRNQIVEICLLTSNCKPDAYARKQYPQKVCNRIPYRKVLVQRTLARRRRLKEIQEQLEPLSSSEAHGAGPKHKGRPRKEPSEQKPKKPPGRSNYIEDVLMG